MKIHQGLANVSAALAVILFLVFGYTAITFPNSIYVVATALMLLMQSGTTGNLMWNTKK